MPKGPLITNDVKKTIATVYFEDTNARAKEIRDKVNKRMRQKNPATPSGWPGLSTVQKELAELRRREKILPPEEIELDEPWHLTSLVKHKLPAEALPAVLGLWLYRRRELPATQKQHPLTVREAYWVAQLYRAITTGIDKLDMEVTFYALYERVTKLLVDELSHSEMKKTYDDIDFHNHATNSHIWYKLVDQEGKDIPRGKWSDVTEANFQILNVISDDLGTNAKGSGGTK